jgi:hypothetical protein
MIMLAGLARILDREKKKRKGNDCRRCSILLPYFTIQYKATLVTVSNGGIISERQVGKDFGASSFGLIEAIYHHLPGSTTEQSEQLMISAGHFLRETLNP